MPNGEIPDLFEDVRESEDTSAQPTDTGSDRPVAKPSPTEPIPDLFSETRGVVAPESKSFFPEFGKATLTIPIRVASNIAKTFTPATAKTLGKTGVELAGFAVKGDILGIPGIPRGMRKEAASKIKAGELAPDMALAIWQDALEPFGFTVEGIEDPGTGGRVVTIEHDFDTVKEVLSTEPERALEALSILASGGATALAKTGKFPKLVKALETAAEFTEPITATGKATKFAVKPAVKAMGAVTTEALGLTTGAGAGAIKRALRNPTPELVEALRGKTSIQGTLSEARDMLHQVKEERAQLYRTRLEQIANISKDLNIAPIEAELKNQLKNFNIKVSQDGTLDFSRSTIASTSDQERIREVVETIQEWGTQPMDATPIGLDTLKRRLDDFYSESSSSRAFVAAVRGKVRDQLVRNVSGYAEMTNDYAQTTGLIKEIERALSLGEKASIDTSLRKLATIMRENNGFRLSLLERLDALSSRDILGEVAGQSLSSFTPRGQQRLGVGINVVGGFTIDPRLLLALPFQSPRAMGEFMVALGLTKAQVNKLMQRAGQSTGGRIATSLTARQAASYGSSALQELEHNLQETSGSPSEESALDKPFRNERRRRVD